ncbi:hypothetical protein BASA81_004220 [Batrachochytrium salamandrivorans]|nr:hypothetical protein BASA81_004220 [Batrachochytrium salamandrivorans]
MVALADSSNDVALDLPLEQSIANGPWTSRGNLKFVLKKTEKMLSVKLDQPTFEVTSKEDIAKINSPGTWVRLRIPAVDSTGQVLANEFLITSQRGCALMRDPKEVLSLVTDKTGAVIALQHERPSLIGTCLPSSPSSLKLATKVVAVMPKESASQPLGMTSNLDLVRAAPEASATAAGGKEEGENKEKSAFQQSFLVQYWYIFGPMFIAYTIFTAPTAPDAPPGTAAAPGKKKE